MTHDAKALNEIKGAISENTLFNSNGCLSVAKDWRGMIAQFEDALGRRLTGDDDAPP